METSLGPASTSKPVDGGFFGLTAFGTGTAFRNSTASPLQLHNIPDKTYLQLFDSRVIGPGKLAEALEVPSLQPSLLL